MALASWGIGFSPVEVPRILELIALAFWFAEFNLLYVGRFNLGDSFRLGTPKEEPGLRVDGLFRLSKNPMYVGMYTTIAASSFYTFNPIVILLGAFVIVIHHSIVLAEEENMKDAFGQQYLDYCSRVRRYIGRPVNGTDITVFLLPSTCSRSS